ncbi:hypothetical protein QFC20_004680 [Naganishia adeliensis]|uniref:Uncharacterized protein n=1 Tax=Naganishia adeliensis TaxID=92952 RepID=A0ACC2VXT2_9TREE|nr:hypothetical protein QFC20_004680 [Naganishia adeliensis]
MNTEIERGMKKEMGTSSNKGTKVIPAWKMITPTYWGVKPSSWEWGQQPGDGFSYNTLGPQWILSPFPYPGHFRIPFSLEETCSSIPIVPQEERVDEAIILGKLTHYFYPEEISNLAPPTEIWPEFEERTGLVPVANARPLPNSPNRLQTLPTGLVNRGPVSFDNYTRQVGLAKVFISIGCQGVPVLIPYSGPTPTPSGFDLYNVGLTQHGPAALIGEPYAYSYERRNLTSFFEAVRKAKENPIPPYFPNEMRLANVARLSLQLANRDLYALSLQVEAERRQRGEPEKGKIPDYVVKTIFEHGWGFRLKADGTATKVLDEA